jgi:hypothetical protein
MNNILQSRCDDLKRATERLSSISAHDALTILKASLGVPKMLLIMRSSPCTDQPLLWTYDNLLREALSSITNNTISDLHWIQASLPVKDGGLGIRSVVTLALSAYLASAAGTLDLQARILTKCDIQQDTYVESALSSWTSRFSADAPIVTNAARQSSWDKPCIEKAKANTISLNDQHNQARLLATRAPHSGDWLHSLPISSCGLRLDDESVRISVGLRLGIDICEPHKCNCGTMVTSQGTHGLACRLSSGRMSRHQQLNDIVCRALNSAQIPACKEPSGLARSDGKRPDGMTLVPWCQGKALIWDVTVADTLAASYVHSTSSTVCGAAELAASKKESKYIDFVQRYIFCPLAIETLGPICVKGVQFLSKLGSRLSATSGDKRETSFLFQRISIAIQRCNAICVLGTFPAISVTDGMTC